MASKEPKHSSIKQEKGWGLGWKYKQEVMEASVVKENESTVEKVEKNIGHTDIKISVSLLFL